MNHENSEEDEDLADAPGDDDEEMRDQPPPVAIMDRRVLDPDLRDRSTLMNDSDPNAGTSNGEGYGGRMLLGLRDYERAMDSNGNL